MQSVYSSATSRQLFPVDSSPSQQSEIKNTFLEIEENWKKIKNTKIEKVLENKKKNKNKTYVNNKQSYVY